MKLPTCLWLNYLLFSNPLPTLSLRIFSLKSPAQTDILRLYVQGQCGFSVRRRNINKKHKRGERKRKGGSEVVDAGDLQRALWQGQTDRRAQRLAATTLRQVRCPESK